MKIQMVTFSDALPTALKLVAVASYRKILLDEVSIRMDPCEVHELFLYRSYP